MLSIMIASAPTTGPRPTTITKINAQIKSGTVQQNEMKLGTANLTIGWGVRLRAANRTKGSLMTIVGEFRWRFGCFGPGVAFRRSPKISGDALPPSKTRHESFESARTGYSWRRRPWRFSPSLRSGFTGSGAGPGAVLGPGPDCPSRSN